MIRPLPLLVLALIALGSGCIDEPSDMTTRTFPVEPGGTIAPPPDAMPIEVGYILDGDSLEADSEGAAIEIRLLGINAPERDECWSDEARAALDDLLGSGPVWLQPAGGSDRFGRVLGYLFTAESFVNHDMVAGGLAIAIDTDHPERAEFLAAEELALAASRGMWRRDACGPAAAEGVVIADIAYDAPGPDDENLNGEWIGLANSGPDADIGGWTVRDESSSHRYSFPTGTVLAAGDALILRTGCGTDGPAEFFWCSDGSVWTNGGDSALLLDQHGNVVDRQRYDGR